MINLLKDNKGNTLRVETCKYCLDPRGKPKIILPEDLPSAIRMPDGSYKCEPCQIEEIQNKILKVTPNSDSAKRITAERTAKQKRDLELRKQWEGIKNMKYVDLWKRTTRALGFDKEHLFPKVQGLHFALFLCHMLRKYP
jgi:hypothetical protein